MQVRQQSASDRLSRLLASPAVRAIEEEAAKEVNSQRAAARSAALDALRKARKVAEAAEGIETATRERLAQRHREAALAAAEHERSKIASQQARAALNEAAAALLREHGEHHVEHAIRIAGSAVASAMRDAASIPEFVHAGINHATGGAALKVSPDRSSRVAECRSRAVRAEVAESKLKALREARIGPAELERHVAEILAEARIELPRDEDEAARALLATSASEPAKLPTI